ncbi:MAG: DUF5012 domain-containing protein [Bacteroidales bacterium]|jgi:hypothetical protein|nr:DUF5012 domain-containing protein [Bacteroidales bacterium]MDD3200890.1 DUF5012 domain-containing protein [Bacteroidales bacterium]
MKKIIYTVMMIVAVVSLASCAKKESLGLTHITYYPSLEVLGDASITVQKGLPYVDAGCKATLQGEDVTSQVTTTSNVNTAVSGVYSVSYSIANAEGFIKTATRQVIVLDLTDPIEGFYTTLNVHTATSSKYDGPWQTLIIKNANGTYYITDFFGGWYAIGRNYGSKYAMTGNFSLSGSTVTLLNSYLSGWGDGLDGMDVGTYNAATGTFYWEVGYAGSMTFYVTMQKN